MTACLACGSQMICGGQIDREDADDSFSLETNFTCPDCQAFMIFWEPVDPPTQAP
jgi:hypothetical protein